MIRYIDHHLGLFTSSILDTLLYILVYFGQYKRPTVTVDITAVTAGIIGDVI